LKIGGATPFFTHRNRGSSRIFTGNIMTKSNSRSAERETLATCLELIGLTLASNQPDATLLDNLRSIAGQLKSDTRNCIYLPYTVGSPQQQRIAGVWKPASNERKDLFFFEFQPQATPAPAPVVETVTPAPPAKAPSKPKGRKKSSKQPITDLKGFLGGMEITAEGLGGFGAVFAAAAGAKVVNKAA